MVKVLFADKTMKTPTYCIIYIYFVKEVILSGYVNIAKAFIAFVESWNCRFVAGESLVGGMRRAVAWRDDKQ